LGYIDRLQNKNQKKRGKKHGELTDQSTQKFKIPYQYKMSVDSSRVSMSNPTQQLKRKGTDSARDQSA
jgi:hypothetical protein